MFYEESGWRRCVGGDFFEIDLLSDNWKVCFIIFDNCDGFYVVKFMVDLCFVGLFVFKVMLLFVNFYVLDVFNCIEWLCLEDIFIVEIEFVVLDL